MLGAPYRNIQDGSRSLYSIINFVSFFRLNCLSLVSSSCTIVTHNRTLSFYVFLSFSLQSFTNRVIVQQIDRCRLPLIFGLKVTTTTTTTATTTAAAAASTTTAKHFSRQSAFLSFFTGKNVGSVSNDGGSKILINFFGIIKTILSKNVHREKNSFVDGTLEMCWPYN